MNKISDTIQKLPQIIIPLSIFIYLIHLNENMITKTDMNFILALGIILIPGSFFIIRMFLPIEKSNNLIDKSPITKNKEILE